MAKARTSKSTSPHALGAIAAVLVLVVGVGVGFYFIELRGPGLQTVMAGAQAQEILVLFGALAAIAVTGQIAIANAARQGDPGKRIRRLARRAQEIDVTDSAALEVFDSVPEIRDLVHLWVNEKKQSQRLGDQIEVLRGEMGGLVAGMERSFEKMGRMREENLSDHGLRLTQLWNQLVERLQKLEAEKAQPQEQAEDRPLELERPATPTMLAGQGDISALVDRLGRIEEKLQQVQSDPVLVARAEPESAAPAGYAPSEPVTEVYAEPEVQPVVEESLVGQPGFEAAFGPVQAPEPQVEPAPVEQGDLGVELPGFETHAKARPEVVAIPEGTQEAKPQTWTLHGDGPQEEVVAEPELRVQSSVQAGPPPQGGTYGEWGGGSQLFELGEEAPQPGFGSSADAVQPVQSEGYQGMGTQVPGEAAPEEVAAELPESAMLFQAEEDEAEDVVDLNALGDPRT